jgi:hypothetical protein
MPPKPHRVLIERVSGYADDASAYLRRRRLTRRPFARVSAPGGRTIDCPPDTETGRELFRAASQVIDAAR